MANENISLLAAGSHAASPMNSLAKSGRQRAAELALRPAPHHIRYYSPMLAAYALRIDLFVRHTRERCDYSPSFRLWETGPIKISSAD